MSYTKTTWSTGDTITSEKLNKIETGIETAQQTADAAQLTFDYDDEERLLTVSLPPASVASVYAFLASS